LRREYPEAPIVGVGAVVIDGTKVLLIRRGHEPLKGQWSLPGGALELGETLQQGIVREVLEETGLSVIPDEIVEVLDRISKEDASGRVRHHYVLIDFVCRVAGGSLQAASDAEDVRWVDCEQLLAERDRPGEYGVAPFTLAVIEKAFGMVRNKVRKKAQKKAQKKQSTNED
jgi:8-oxo-dGTP diphosphatase